VRDDVVLNDGAAALFEAATVAEVTGRAGGGARRCDGSGGGSRWRRRSAL
jgi:hypothetical protein